MLFRRRARSGSSPLVGLLDAKLGKGFVDDPFFDLRKLSRELFHLLAESGDFASTAGTGGQVSGDSRRILRRQLPFYIVQKDLHKGMIFVLNILEMDPSCFQEIIEP
jgi:hypothetical protein